MIRTCGPATVLSEPKSYEGWRVLLEARMYRFRLGSGAFMWSRPVAVYVEKPIGRKRIPVRDTTRRLQLILAFSLFVSVAGPIILWRHERSYSNV